MQKVHCFSSLNFFTTPLERKCFFDFSDAKLALSLQRCCKNRLDVLLTKHEKHCHVMKTLPMHCKKHCLKTPCASHNAWGAFSIHKNASHALWEAHVPSFCNTSNEILTLFRRQHQIVHISLEVLQKSETCASYNAWEAFLARENASHAL